MSPDEGRPALVIDARSGQAARASVTGVAAWTAAIARSLRTAGSRPRAG